MEWMSRTSHHPLVIIPFVTSIVLVIGSPEAELAQPRALIGGHIVATLVGLAMLWLTGPQAWAAAAAVAWPFLQCTFHPTAGINPLLGVSNNLPGSFLFAPVLAWRAAADCGCVCLASWIRRRQWPQRWL
jgi:CBS-domain-containing membrane protein